MEKPAWGLPPGFTYGNGDIAARAGASASSAYTRVKVGPSTPGPKTCLNRRPTNHERSRDHSQGPTLPQRLLAMLTSHPGMGIPQVYFFFFLHLGSHQRTATVMTWLFHARAPNSCLQLRQDRPPLGNRSRDRVCSPHRRDPVAKERPKWAAERSLGRIMPRTMRKA